MATQKSAPGGKTAARTTKPKSAPSNQKNTKKTGNERDTTLLAAISHFSILATFVMGPFAMVIPLIIWLLERSKADGSPLVEFQANQAFFYQIALWVVSAALGIIIGILSIIVIGVLFIPVLILFVIAAIVYGVVGGLKVMQGEDFRYIIIADFIDPKR